jgi:hypothetical protein
VGRLVRLVLRRAKAAAAKAAAAQLAELEAEGCAMDAPASG